MQTKPAYRNGTTPGAGAPLPVIDDRDDLIGSLLDEYDSLISELAQAFDAALTADARLQLLLERIALGKLALQAAIDRAAGRTAGGA